MNKQEFLIRLEHLLSDISAEERADAMTFYENYFDDAGPENEEKVIHDLGSPERVVVSIKKNLAQTCDEGSGQTDGQKQDYNRYDSYYESYQKDPGNPSDNSSLSGRIKRKLNEWQFYREHRTFCIVMFIAILVVTIPAWGSILGGILSVIFGILGTLFGIIAACFTLAIAGIIVGISLICVGIGSLAAAIAPGLFLIGIGLVCLAFGSLFTLATAELCGRFLPWCYRSIRDLILQSKQSPGGAAA